MPKYKSSYKKTTSKNDRNKGMVDDIQSLLTALRSRIIVNQILKKPRWENFCKIAKDGNKKSKKYWAV